ncbi:peptidoglycan -binding protein [Allorhizobium sp. BGMRC 0089]|uniref:peptidoglycan -binding protein n=1 Tax=Allorhizobium sonneratiae TaxID=2934936 RepID=UPI0020348C13|nr:peptidoglycan -binding protein [Allorhizobium sonneratiae]MCM2290877.1 peptidoglycan -binding protein [Allorhizobium sonneratiae]
MALSRNRRRERGGDYWPGFVDALSTLLIAIMFILTVFVVAQFVLSREISGKDAVLNRLNNQIAELTQMLALEKSGKQDMEQTLANLQASLATSEKERTRLQSLLDSGSGNAAQSDATIRDLTGKLANEQQVSARAMNQIELLNQQIAALRAQIAAVEQALQVSEAKDQASQAKITDLGRRLNVALAQRVQELNRYRSDFFGRLREILADRQNIRIVGDRFVFQSEVLFASGSADLNPQGQEEMAKLASVLLDISKEIPADIPWVLRVDGHTDNVPLSGNGRFADNWALSAARAISVVKFLISKGVPANRLVAAGFGEYDPIAPGDTPEARAQNRRIELKLTEK